MYIIIWSFRIREGSRKEFEKAYGPTGAWVRLFKSGAGYLQTELLHDHNEPNHYLTIDRWASQADYEQFRRNHEAEYHALDRQCELLTLEEQSMGGFLLNDGDH